MILVTGASGFLGSTVANLAASRELSVRALVRKNSDCSQLILAPEVLFIGDMQDHESLEHAVKGVDAVIHCAATTSATAPDPDLSQRVNVEGSRALVAACEKHHVRRYVQISSQSALAHNQSVYGRTKFQADEIVRASRLDWTILKPGLIYGPGKSGVFQKVVEFVDKFPVVPVLGSGQHEQRPVHVEDVAWAALECLKTDATIRKEYDLGGQSTLTFDEMIRAIMDGRGKRKPLAHLPLPLCMLLAKVLGTVMKNPPVTTDNVLGVRIAGHVDNTAAERDFGFNPKEFKSEMRAMLALRNQE